LPKVPILAYFMARRDVARKAVLVAYELSGRISTRSVRLSGNRDTLQGGGENGLMSAFSREAARGAPHRPELQLGEAGAARGRAGQEGGAAGETAASEKAGVEGGIPPLDERNCRLELLCALHELTSDPLVFEVFMDGLRPSGDRASEDGEAYDEAYDNDPEGLHLALCIGP